jgi:transposase-like protein
MGQALQVVQEFEEEREAYHYLERLRWPGGRVCPRCGSSKVTVASKGFDRTRTGKSRDLPIWRCRTCRTYFSVFLGMPLAHSRIPASTWVKLMRFLCAAAGPVTVGQVKAVLPFSEPSIQSALRRVLRALRSFPLKESWRSVRIQGQ